MVKWIKTWWKVKKAKRALWKQVAIEQARDEEKRLYIKMRAAELAQEWLERNEFGLKQEDLNARCMSAAPKLQTKHVYKEIDAC
jgi:hypothetical protein